MNVKFALIPLFNRLHSTWGLGSGPVKFAASAFAFADATAYATATASAAAAAYASANVFLRIV